VQISPDQAAFGRLRGHDYRPCGRGDLRAAAVYTGGVTEQGLSLADARVRSQAEGERVLVVDDHPGMRILIQKALGRAGYDVASAKDGPEALAQFIEAPPDCVLLDVLMPGMDGYELCRRLREMSDVPIIMVSALRNEDEIVRGLDAGADDYVTKPFSVVELVARVRAVQRRYRRGDEDQKHLVFGAGHLQIDLPKHQVILDGVKLHLGPTEFRLLAYLAANAGRVVPHPELIEQIWGPEGAHLDKYLRIYMRRLRRKIEPESTSPHYLISAHGVGYGFDPDAGRPISWPKQSV
jgi:two-component system KDP operon response regulator KdpE